jgi:hypothetical protein
MIKRFLLWLWDFRPGRKRRRILRQYVEAAATIEVVNWVLENSADFAREIDEIGASYQAMIRAMSGDKSLE